MSELLAIGSKAPAFTAPASDGKTYTLADVLKTKHVALVFYPGNNTPRLNPPPPRRARREAQVPASRDPAVRREPRRRGGPRRLCAEAGLQFPAALPSGPRDCARLPRAERR